MSSAEVPWDNVKASSKVRWGPLPPLHPSDGGRRPVLRLHQLPSLVGFVEPVFAGNCELLPVKYPAFAVLQGERPVADARFHTAEDPCPHAAHLE